MKTNTFIYRSLYNKLKQWKIEVKNKVENYNGKKKLKDILA